MTSHDITFPTPQENILYDEVLLYLAEQGIEGESLRFWEFPEYFIVLGRIGKAEEDIALEEAVKNHIPVLRRYSGGGTVIQGKGCLNYNLVLSKEIHAPIADLRKSYEYILGKVISALKTLDIECVFKPISDIALAASEKKFSGNAQHRGKKFILHHGTILYDFDLSLIERYLKFPQSAPPYRRGRTHSEFVANVDRRAPAIKRALQDIFNAQQEETQPHPKRKEYLETFLHTKNPTVDIGEY